MSERIKRYVFEGVAFGSQCSESDDGDWCHSADVAAIEAENEVSKQQAKDRADWFDYCQRHVPCVAGRKYDAAAREYIEQLRNENARLRRIVEAGDKMKDCLHEYALDADWEAVAYRLIAAYDAAKAQATQQGEKKT